MPKLIFVDVGDIDHRLIGEQEKVGDPQPLFGGEALRPDRLAGIEPLANPVQHRQLNLGLLGGLAYPFRRLLRALAALLYALEILEAELGLDDLDVARGVHGAVHVNDVDVFEAADDMDDGVDLADLGEELVAAAAAGAGPFDEPGDVDELEAGGSGLGRLVERRERDPGGHPAPARCRRSA